MMLYKKKPEELSPDEIKDLQATLSYFFIDHSYEQLKTGIWDLYRGWVYGTAEHVTPEDITEMLMFYENLQLWLSGVYEYAQYLDVVILKREKSES